MESNFLTAVFLPLALFIIMLGLGLGLTINDFKRVIVTPKAIGLGLLAQLILLPVVGFMLAKVFVLSPELAVGLIILAACPGGPTSNLMTYLAKGNVALSITLTAISSLITVFTIPVVVNLAMTLFLDEGSTLQLPIVSTVIQIAAIVLIPVSLGMAIRRRMPRVAIQIEEWVKWLSLGFLGLIIAGLMIRERANIVSFFLQVGWVTFTLMAIAMSLGYSIAKLARLDEPSATSITIEVGIQNGTLAIAIASSPAFLGNPVMAIPAAIYALLMYAISGVFAWWIQRKLAVRAQTMLD